MWFTNLTRAKRRLDPFKRLEARPELSRTYFEIGKRLLESKSGFSQLKGIKATEYLDKARVMFEEMDLQWDLDQLDRITAYI